jgi:hypothetical protein
VKVVTTISSKGRAHHRERDESERRERSGTEVRGGLLERRTEPLEPRLHVVEDRDDAERRMRDHDRDEAQLEAQHRPEGVVEGDTGDDARQCDRQDDQQRDDVAAEEAGTPQRQTRHRAEDERDRGRQQRNLHADHQCVPCA